MNYKMNKESIKIVLTLVGFVFFAALAIAFTNEKTYETIKQREREAQAYSLKIVLSDGSEKKEDSIAGFGKFYRETVGGKTIGYAFMGEAKGYSSKIKFFCGIDTEGRIKGLSIISQNETPGLGTRVIETISNARFPLGLVQKQEETEPWFCTQYKGISAVDRISLNKGGEWHALSQEARDRLLRNNQITVITGSTITTAAITSELSARAKLLVSLLGTTSPTTVEQAINYEGEDADD